LKRDKILGLKILPRKVLKPLKEGLETFLERFSIEAGRGYNSRPDRFYRDSSRPIFYGNLSGLLV
jgi:hypothetical protein